MQHEFAPPASDLVRQIVDQISDRLASKFPTTSPWMVPEDAAKYLGLKRRGLEDMRARSVGPKYHKVNERIVRYHVNDLDLWLLSNGGRHD